MSFQLQIMYQRYVMDKSTQTITITMDDIRNEWRRSRGQAVQIVFGGPPPPVTPYMNRPPRQQTNNCRERSPPRWRRDNVLGDPVRSVTLTPAVYAQGQPHSCTPFNGPDMRHPINQSINQHPGRAGPRQRLAPTQHSQRSPSTEFIEPFCGPRGRFRAAPLNPYPQPPAYTANNYDQRRSTRQDRQMGSQALRHRPILQQPIRDPIWSDTEDEELGAEAFGEFLQQIAQLHVDAQLPTNDNHTLDTTIHQLSASTDDQGQNVQRKRRMHNYTKPTHENHQTTTVSSANPANTINSHSTRQPCENLQKYTNIHWTSKSASTNVID
jgi:hypothetical protein